MYEQDANLFRVNPVSGLVTARVSFNYEQQMYYEVPVLAVDQAQSMPRTATAIIKLTITDVNDEPPQFILKEYEFHHQENKPPNSIIGTISASDMDSDPFDTIIFKLENAGSTFSIDGTTGEIMCIETLDREVAAEYHFTVTTFNPGSPQLHNTANVSGMTNSKYRLSI